MQSPDLLRVSRGLAVAHWGVRLITGTFLASAAILVVFVLFDFSRGWTRDYFYIAMLGILIALIPTGIAVGVLVGFIGRPFCLRTPPELPIARARIRLAVLLEACGLTTAVMFIPFAFMLRWATGVFPNEVVAYPVFAFSFVLFIAGRVFFLTYTTALAEAVGMQVSHRPSVAMVTLIICGSAVIATLCSLGITGGKSLSTLTEVLPVGIVFVVALCVFGTLYQYGRHLRRLREAVKRFNTPPAEEVALVLVERPQ